MLYLLHHHSLFNKQPFSLPHISLITNPKSTPLASVCPDTPKTNLYFSSSSSRVVHAVDKDSQHYEIDPDKAREALQNLDQQLQDLSKKQVASPKVKVSDVKITRDQTTEEVPEFSGSFLATVTAGLFLFTIFYNILYVTVIDPPNKGIESAPGTPALENEPPEAAVLQLLPLAPNFFSNTPVV